MLHCHKFYIALCENSHYLSNKIILLPVFAKQVQQQEIATNIAAVSKSMCRFKRQQLLATMSSRIPEIAPEMAKEREQQLLHGFISTLVQNDCSLWQLEICGENLSQWNTQGEQPPNQLEEDISAGSCHSAQCKFITAHFFQVRKKKEKITYYQCHRHVRVMCNAGNDVKQSGNLDHCNEEVCTQQQNEFTSSYTSKQYTILNNRRLH